MKVLIISHNPVSSQSNMGKTFLSLFSEFGRSELCQLYIYPTLPNGDRCASYYRVTDKEALRSVLLRGRIGGPIPQDKIDARQGSFENAEDESFYRSRKNKSPLRRLLRDLIWKLAPWYNAGLKAWLNQEKPDCIFVAPGVAKFLYDFALRIAGDLKIPIVTYVCDEYYFVKRPKFGLDRLRLRLLQRKIETLMEKTSHLAVISRELQEAYSRKFQTETTVLMTGAGFPAASQISAGSQPQALCYFGNIRCNRFVSLGQIGKILDEINREQGTDYRLKIYSAEKNEQILESLRQYSSVELCGFLTGAAFEQALRDAHLLLHTEAFDEASVDFVQHSVSTKIADSLASGIPLVAYGPAQISSMQHLIRNECAITAGSEQELRGALLTAFQDASTRERVAQKGLAVARACHDSHVTSQTLRQILTAVSDNG